MSKPRFMPNFLACAAAALAFAATAHAQNNRTFVATTGSDSNNCGPTTPCRTFAAALALTNPAGELVVLTSGGYGAFSINQPVTITAIGVDASVTATSGNAITISTTGNVTITGLNLNGGGTGQDGVNVEAVGFLRLYNMQIQGFPGGGIDFTASGHLAVYDSKINDCGGGIGVNNASAEAYVHNTDLDDNGVGAGSPAGALTIADSSVHYNSVVGVWATGGTITLINDRIMFNGEGIATNGGSLVFGNCLLSGNTYSYFVGSTGTIASTSPGTSLITAGQMTHGTLSTANVLQ